MILWNKYESSNWYKQNTFTHLRIKGYEYVIRDRNNSPVRRGVRIFKILELI